MDTLDIAMLAILIAMIVIAIFTGVVQKKFKTKNELYALKQSSSQKTGAQIAQEILRKKDWRNVLSVVGVSLDWGVGMYMDANRSRRRERFKI